MSSGNRFGRTRKVRDLALATLTTCLFAVLPTPPTAEAVLPTQNELDPRHLDFGPATVAPGETVSQIFADPLNSAEDWFAELLIGNPTSNAAAIAFDAKFVFPGGSQQGTVSLQPGFAFLLQVEPVDVPETSPNWLFTFTNPTGVSLIVESVVSEALSVTIPPEFGEIFVAPDETLVGPGGGNEFTPRVVTGDFVSVEIVPSVPEPTGLILLGTVIVLCVGALLRRRPDAV